MATDPAEILTDGQLLSLRLLEREYDGYQPPSTSQILARARTARTERVAPSTTHRHPEHEQAVYELNLAATLVLQLPSAAAKLAQLDTLPFPDADAALVLACLMHVSERAYAAQFWWKYAAGGGNATAATCLYLAHRTRAEFLEAEHWRRQATMLRAEAGPRSAARSATVPPVPARELRELLAQCYRGHRLQLPALMQGAVERLGIIDNDEFTGKHPQPSPMLIKALAPGATGQSDDEDPCASETEPKPGLVPAGCVARNGL